jgi:valyl-tRNA synthetase
MTNYNAKKTEARWQKQWEENDIYRFDEDTRKEVFSIDTPPPTISGRMHIGHAFSYTQADFIARFKRMKNFEVFYPFGTDNNGLATEKLVQKEKKVNLRKVSREEAIQICNDFLKEERPRFIQDFKNIGLSCDFKLEYSTIDDHSRKLSQKTFLELVKKGLIIRKEGPVMWDRVFQTPIAQAELEDLEMTSSMNYVKAKIKDSENTYVIYATTRPELLFGCAGMSIEDKGEYVKLKVGDEYWIFGSKTYEEKLKDFEFEVVETLKGENLMGQTAIIPIIEREVTITHDSAVAADKGTGIAYFCSYGGLEDIEYFSRHQLKPIEVLSKDGRLNNKCDKYEGMLTQEARSKIIKHLDEIKALVQSEKITHIVNVGERSGVEVEYIVAKQWYVTYLDKKEYLFEMAQKFSWHPDFMKHRLENWIKGLNWDWGFSRQRHFGIPIPAWYCKKCGETIFAEENQLPVDPTTTDAPRICSCGSKKFVPETDIMDTWFTSASSPSLAVELVKNEKTRKKLFPMDLRPQAHDIINFWLFYTMAKTNLLYDMNPFKHVMVSGWVLDPKGKKMSKSKGNTILPQDVVEKFSNDCLRYAASASKLGSDIPFQEKELVAARRLVTKIWNACKFSFMHLETHTYKADTPAPEKITTFDAWLLSKLHRVIDEATRAFEEFEYSKAIATVEKFFWQDFCDLYLEVVKDRMYNTKNYSHDAVKSGLYTLNTCVKTILKLFAPFVPFITEEVYHQFYTKNKTESIHRTSWPAFEKERINEDAESVGELVRKIVEDTRKAKSEKGVSLKEPVKYLKVRAKVHDTDFEKVKKDILGATKAEEITYEHIASDSEMDYECVVEI